MSACTTKFVVNQVTQFTLTGTNEDVTLAVASVYYGFTANSKINTYQIEVSPNKSIAKVFASDDTNLGLVPVKDAREALQASKICYTQDTVLAVSNPNKLDYNEIRARLNGNVEIRSLVTGGDFTFVQVPPEYLIFAEQILESCDPNELACYNEKKLNCGCVPKIPQIVQSVIGKTLQPTASLTLTLNNVSSSNSIYVLVQTLNLPTTITVYENTNPNNKYILDKSASIAVAMVGGTIAYSAIFHTDTPLNGTNNISINVDSDDYIIGTAIEITGAYKPSVDTATTGIGSNGTGNQQSDTITTSNKNELGLLSVSVISTNKGNEFDGTPVESELIEIGNFDFLGGTFSKALPSSGTNVLSSSIKNPSENDIWSASAVGIKPKPCPTNPSISCYYPVPNCEFRYPCEVCNGCNTHKKSTKK